ncbi:hypothetical protein BLOT_010783 [Blomia tropicalis]|nr:hypothetical protein BLOT_010783 [Blomia tropicalis]
MTTSINLSNDLNDYLKNSNSSVNGGQPSTNGFLNGWFNGTNSKTFSYQPLRTVGSENELARTDGSINNNQTRSSWFKNPFSAKEPEPEGWLPSLSRTQRFIGFLAFIFMGITCFGISTMYIPVLLFKARKFSILFTFGSAFIVLSFAILLGPVNHLKNQFSRDRLPFTLAYFGSLIATLYFAMSVQSVILTTIFALIQVIALVWYVVTYIPGGHSSLMFFSRIAANTVTKTLPV